MALLEQHPDLANTDTPEVRYIWMTGEWSAVCIADVSRLTGTAYHAVVVGVRDWNSAKVAELCDISSMVNSV